MSASASFHRFARLDRCNRRLLAEAVAVLAVMRVATIVLPFRRAIRVGSVRVNGKAPDPALMRRIVWSVGAAAARVPWRAVCLQQGLTAQIMLRRRGIDAQLLYGIGKREAGDLGAHVWVCVDGQAVVGGEAAQGFPAVASYPGPAV